MLLTESNKISLIYIYALFNHKYSEIAIQKTGVKGTSFHERTWEGKFP